MRRPTVFNLPFLFLSVLLALLVTNAYTSVMQSFLWQTSVTAYPETLKVFSDSGLSTEVTNIDWGELSPGENITKIVYIKNTSMSTVMNLSLTTSDWTPVNASNYIYLTWNCSGFILNPSDVIASKFVLNVNSSITGITNFAFNITIWG